MNEPQEPRSAPTEHPAADELSELAFSPEAGAAGLREHVRDCAACAAEIADLRALLASLAELPEPELPESVGIRLDAAIARAWQEADAEQEAATTSRPADAPRSGASRRAGLWRKLAVPLGAVCLVAVAVVGVAKLAGGGAASSSGATSAGGANPGPVGDSALTRWVQSVLPTNGSDHAAPDIIPQADGGSANSTFASIQCPSAPAHAGYAEVASSRRLFQGRLATLVVYQNDREPATQPVFAVVYAGSSCPTASSAVLDEGLVSR